MISDQLIQGGKDFGRQKRGEALACDAQEHFLEQRRPVGLRSPVQSSPGGDAREWRAMRVFNDPATPVSSSSSCCAPRATATPLR